jgi:hypothetical protein
MKGVLKMTDYRYSEELPKEKIENGIHYVLDAETQTYLPDFQEIEEEQEPIGRFGKLREKYLKEYYPSTYSRMLMTGKLTPHLRQIDQQAWEMEEKIVSEMAEADNLTEKMKDTDQLTWVGMMNNYRHSAQEIIIKELIETE